MTYVTSGEVCKLLNITKYTLRHYIEQDLVRPAKVAQNGYQLFDEKEIYTLYQILFLKKAGFSLKDISETFSNEQSITLSYQEMLDQVEKQIQELSEVKQRLEHMLSIQNSLQLNKTTIQDRPIRYLKQIPHHLLKGETELDLSLFEERYYVINLQDDTTISYYVSNERDYDVRLDAGSYAVKSFLAGDEEKVIEEIEAFLHEVPFTQESAQPSSIILYENVPVSVTYQNSMVYTVEQGAGNRR
ncbi:MerR family transcriptional regulator [Bacillus sp. A31]|uniref:MerR family transcriptional regulator n=1 Tax=Bacillus sp. A31 TaxID=3102787 RepID=UPI0039B3ECC7